MSVKGLMRSCIRGVATALLLLSSVPDIKVISDAHAIFSPECDVDYCFSEWVVWGVSLDTMGGGGGGGGGGRVIYMDQVSGDQQQTALIDIANVADLQCISSLPPGSNTTPAQVHELGRTTSRDSDEKKQDMMNFLVGYLQARGELGRNLMPGVRPDGSPVQLMAVKFADGGEQLYFIYPSSSIKAVPVLPNQLRGGPFTLRVDGDGIPRVKCAG